jgi:hypothetical protein
MNHRLRFEVVQERAEIEKQHYRKEDVKA